jgi:hypothetical protein
VVVGNPESPTPECPVPSDPQHQQYAPRHRAVPISTSPVALSGPRHLGNKRHPARRALRGTVTLTGLAAAATGVAVVTGVVQSPGAAVDLADSLSPVASSGGSAAASTDVQDRTTVVSRSSDRTLAVRADSHSSRQTSRQTSRHADRRTDRDPAKAAALGLSSGPAVGGQESLSAQDPQAIAEALLPTFGFDSSQMSCLVPLWMGESGWRVSAENASSGAYGIPQALPGSKMVTAGADWRTNAATQIEWGLGYIRDRYGSPCGAWGFKQGHGWY